MAHGYEVLSDKEKETLRLILHGHDAKSMARELTLSVHTINERLRSARRKLDVTSSKEAARLLFEEEAGTPQFVGHKSLGDEAGLEQADLRNDRSISAWVIGGIAMLTLAIAIAVSTPIFIETDERPAVDVQNVEEAAEVQAAARDFLSLVDERDWAGSFAATSEVFQSANTVEQWAEASRLVYGPLGDLRERGEATVRFVNAPPRGYREVSFVSRFSNREEVTEILTLEKEDGVWKVVGIMVN